jgi:two-component system sensor histidine kinase DegS
MMLDDLGLTATLKRYVETFKDETGFDAKVEIKGGEKKLAPYIEVMIFRAVQELMGNVVRHNSELTVKPNIAVQMAIEEKFVRVNVSDNGKGFNPTELENRPTIGLKLIRDRVEMLGGYFETDASPGQGARVTFQIPVVPANRL